MASRKDSIYGIEIGKGVTLAQYLPEDNAVGSIVIKPISDAPAQQYDATLRSELKDLIADLELKRQWVAVSLPSEFAIVKKVSLDGDEDDPGEAILWELSQHVIGSIEEYSVDFDPIGKPSPDAVQQYLVVAYRTASVRKLVSLLKANKLSPCIVDLDMFAIINVFEANYPERLSLPALLVLAFASFVLIELWPDLHRPAGVTYLPISIGDVYIRFDFRGALRLACVVFGPPALLTAGWFAWRRGSHKEPPA